tara:strand:- start:150 stop:509 length:360 start_codon:yes stop_codon:yes gene_type:complete
MKIKILVIAAWFLCASVFADEGMKRKYMDISTVDDVREFRASKIERMNAKLASGDLNERRVKFLKKRISLLQTKPLPTQEQINWLKENHGVKKSFKRQKNKGKAWKKRKLMHKKRNLKN